MAAQPRPKKARRCTSQASFVDPEELTRRLSLLLIQEQYRELDAKRSKGEQDLFQARQEEAERSRKSSRTQSALCPALSPKTHTQTVSKAKLAPAPRLVPNAHMTTEPTRRTLQFVTRSHRTSKVLDSETTDIKSVDGHQFGQRLRCESAPDLQIIKEVDHGMGKTSQEICHPGPPPMTKGRRFSVMSWIRDKSPDEPKSSGGTSLQSRTRSVLLLDIAETHQERHADREGKDETEHHSNDATLINSKRSSTGIARAVVTRKRSSILKKLDDYWFPRSQPSNKEIAANKHAEDDEKTLSNAVRSKKFRFLSKLRL
ncbi:hypothetical protein BD289DRAFT_21786 [Coniella lustricola]|uniref:Uncharacterized protein n=1 Tax=Coniella lustricola TaxID=2025994 RepID=A0A2T3A3I5_9PEZI|nr:hypothetical protein BD289DRAFT_21786 [Coniella lustricola]